MSLSPKAASVAADAVLAMADGGWLRVLGTQQVLAELALPNPAFNKAIDGYATAHGIASAVARATGIADRVEVIGPTGETVFTGSVGTKDADLILNTTRIVADARVTVMSLTYTQRRG